ncbi:MAG: hypothetical protein K0R53_2884, partial [Burkholderiales bacterium]|nr:hypothetical protein [Burkholderiales bacterium]
MPGRKFFDCEGSLNPKNVDGAVYSTSVLKGYRHSSQTIIDRMSAIWAANETRIANPITAP